jgi:hypothetical protein
MPAAKKKTIRKASKKSASTVIVIERSIAAKDTLFPEKVAKGKKILRNTKFHDPRFLM